MKFTARVVKEDGASLERGKVELVIPQGTALNVLAVGKLEHGALTVAGEPGPVWGLRIAGKAVVGFPVSVTEKALDLGEIVWLESAVAFPAFHSEGGFVHGIPRALCASTRDPKAAAKLVSDFTAAAASLSKSGITFGDAVGSAAQQLGKAAANAPGFALSGASVKLKGIPTATETTLGLDFPTAELAATGVGLSELSFALKPIAAAGTQTIPVPAAPAVPNVAGYTRELAVRKLAAAGFCTEINNERVSDSSQAGRVVRQLPAAGTQHATGGMVRLFIGRQDGT